MINIETSKIRLFSEKGLVSSGLRCWHEGLLTQGRQRDGTTSSVIPWIFNSPYDYKWLYKLKKNKNLRCVLTQRWSSSLSRGKVGSTPADVLPSICKSLNVFCLICKLNLASSFTVKGRQTFFERLISTDAFRPLSAPLKQVTWTVNF